MTKVSASVCLILATTLAIETEQGPEYKDLRLNLPNINLPEENPASLVFCHQHS